MLKFPTMLIATKEYTIRHGQYSRPDLDHITLEAIRLSDNRQLGHITLELMPEHESSVKLGKITTYYPIRTVGGGNIDYGGNGIGTMLLLQGMMWARDKDARYVVGRFAPEKDKNSLKNWYENRSIFVSADLQTISGIVTGVIYSCQSIIALY